MSEGSASASYLALCVCGVWIFWSAHDYIQERIFLAPGFHFGLFMAFSLQTSSFLLSLAYRGFAWVWELTTTSSEQRYLQTLEAQRRRRAEAEEAEEEELGEEKLLENDGAPEAAPAAAPPLPSADAASLTTLAWYLLLSLLIAAANGSATVALNYVNMQTKVLVKSSKIVSVMMLGRLCFGRFYSALEYGHMLMVVLGLVAFMLATKRPSTGGADTSLIGVALLSLAVVVDSLVPNVQQRLLVQHHRPKHELVFHTNWISAALTLCYMAATGEGVDALIFLRRRPHLAMLLLVQSVCGFLGILTYLETVRGFGSKITVLVTSCRKLFTIGLSSFIFRHPLNSFHVIGVGAVFAGVLWNANSELRCSRWLVLPALLVVGLAVAMELDLLSDGGAASIALEAKLRKSLLFEA